MGSHVPLSAKYLEVVKNGGDKEEILILTVGC